MTALNELERAVLEAIARQVPKISDAIMSQIAQADVVDRENTGAGLYSVLDVSNRTAPADVSSPAGDIGAQVVGLNYGMGFLLWMESGYMKTLEGYSYGEDTSVHDFSRVVFTNVQPRCVGS